MLAYDTYPELYKQSAIYAICFGNIYICIQIFLVKINQNLVIAYQSITCLFGILPQRQQQPSKAAIRFSELV